MIGCSSVNDIRLGSIIRSRDIALPFPSMPLPTMADGYASPRTSDFMFHDFYHAIRASDISERDTAYYIAMGDYLANMQLTLNQELNKHLDGHKHRKEMIPAFLKKIKLLFPVVQEQAIRRLVEKFNQELVIINTLKKLRKHIAQLKFIMYDMEHPGMSTLGLQSATDSIAHILRGIQSSILVLNAKPDAHTFGNKINTVVCHAALHAMKLDTSILNHAADVLRDRGLTDFMSSAIEQEIASRPVASQLY